MAKVPATGAGDTLALLISGNGGCAGIDQALAARIAKPGALSSGSIRCAISGRNARQATPRPSADRILHQYLTASKKHFVLLIGFSQGAEVMPFMVDRLPPATCAQLQSVVLLSPSQSAVFEFHLQNWLGASNEDVPVAPELLKMTGVRALCVYGEQEDDSMCIQPEAKALQVIKLKGGHHFDGNYDTLARLILARAH